MTRPRIALATLVLAVTAAACSNGGPASGGSAGSGGSATAASGSFSAEVASTDLYVGAPQRLDVGVFHNDAQGIKVLSFGAVGLGLDYLGADPSAAPQHKADLATTYVPAPGTQATGTGPALSDPGTARGIYQANGVTFDQPGTWQVTVTANVQGLGAQTLTAAFSVAATPVYPAPGQKAIPSQNLTARSKGVPASAVDSRAQPGTPIPDPELHQWTIAQAMAQHRPIVAIFATPLYCVSEFCGPATDSVAQLAKTYGDRAVFIHVEIWRKYGTNGGGTLNKAAADWLYRNGNLTEPWLFLIGADGVIMDRWSPLFDPNEVAQELQQLPKMKG